MFPVSDVIFPLMRCASYLLRLFLDFFALKKRNELIIDHETGMVYHKDSTLKNCMGLPLPDKFSGKKKSEAKSFKSQFERVFKLQPRRFADDETKILYVAIFLSGAANS